MTSASPQPSLSRFDADHPHYKWVALSNTTLGMFLATINSSIVLISLPAIFRGIGLDPLAPGNGAYLLWMLMGFLLVTAVFVVTFGRLGDIYGRVQASTTSASWSSRSRRSRCRSTRCTAAHGALWLICWRVVQGIGGAMLFANSAAILTDAFPSDQRGLALGINQVAAIAGSFLGLVLGGLLSEWDWRAVFWVSVPIAHRSAPSGRTGRCTRSASGTRPRSTGGATSRSRSGWAILLAGITYGIEPYGGHSMGWTNPWVHRRARSVACCCSRCSASSRPGHGPDVRDGAVQDPGVHGGEPCRPAGLDGARRACSSC